MSMNLFLFYYCCCSVAQSYPTLCDPWTAAHQASLSFTVSQSLPKLMSVESVIPSNHLILCHPLLLLPLIFPSIRIFSNELALHIRWTKYWSFSIRPSYEYSGFPLGLTSLIFFQEYWSAFSFTRGSSLTQGSNPRLLHQQAESLPLSHQRG